MFNIGGMHMCTRTVHVDPSMVLGETWRRGVYMTFSLREVTLEPLPSRQLPDYGVGRAQSSLSSG